MKSLHLQMNKRKTAEKAVLWYHKKGVKILAGILCILSFNIMTGSFFGVAVMESMGIYEKEESKIKEEVFDSAKGDYSVLAMTRYEDDFAMEELSKTNFRYGVIQTDSIEGLDLNDKNIYEVCNFDKEVQEDMLHIYSCNMGDATYYSAGKNLFGNFYIYNEEKSCNEVCYPIEACYYVRNTNKIYYLANGCLYQENGDAYVNNESLAVSDGENSNGYNETAETWKLADEIAAENTIEPESTEEPVYTWKNPGMQVIINDMTFYLSDISIVTMGELEEIGEVMPVNGEGNDYVEYFIQNGSILTYKYEFFDTKPYFVLSYVNEPLVTAGPGNYLNQNLATKFMDWDKQDFFVQLTVILDIAYSIRYGIYVVLVVSMIVFLITFVLMMAGAGHKKGYEGIKEGYFDKIPFDICTCLVVIIISVLLTLMVEGVYGMPIRLACLFGIFAVAVSEWLGFIYLKSTAVRFKKGKWWRNTLIYKIWQWCTGIILRIWKWCKKGCGNLSQALPFLWKAWLIMGGLAFLEFIGLLSTGYNPDVQLFLWFLEKVVVYGALTICLLQLHRLQQGAKKIADGETDSRIDTSKMFLEFKEHGENLNRIREGIGKAVAERMKSERFKTELITNVSHDIKTPLTSIINYVDLMEKEEINNPKIQEYLEVLSRQSTRLKKLIEDLMEASKASTGNLAVAYECCDAGVMLTQTIGEFEEKLKAGEIELMVQNSKEPVYIQADPRHLWRIFDNLMNNICKYAQSSTRAYVNIEREGSCGRIIFRNISKYALNIDSEELMERFVRGDSSRNTEGSGLGLSIAKSLTELMQGTFELVVDGDLFKVILTFPVTENSAV